MSSRAKILEAAEDHVRSGRLKEAMAEYGRLLDGGANDVSLNSILGDLHLRLGQRDEALKLFITNMAVLDKRGAFAQALAVAKKIHKIDPSNGEIRERMGDLYGRLGFAAEARTEYAEAARLFQEGKDIQGRLSVYEKLAGLDRTDFDTRLKLARLLAAEKRTERAVVEFNAIADIQSARGDDGDAERTLREALALGPADVRTVTGLVRICRRAGRLDQAAALLDAVPGASSRPEFLLLLGGLRAEAGEPAQARECYERILVNDPEHAEARAHLGRLEVQAGQPDRAFALLEPLVTQAIHKGRDDRAIGLLGLILMSGALHLPSLEKLAHIHRLAGRRTELEIVDRLLLKEYRKCGLAADRERILKELAALSPRDRVITEGKRALGKNLPKPSADEDGPTPFTASTRSSRTSWSESDRDLIKTNLAKADLYIEQGLVRNARRILENLRMLYPGEPRLESRLALIQGQEKATDDVDIPVMIQRILSLESETAGEMPEDVPAAGEAVGTPAGKPGKTVSLEEIFGATDLTATAPPPGGRRAKDYPDLSDKIREEREAMDLAFYGQLKARTGSIEKDLSEIVTDFRKRVEQRVARESGDVRYNLGLAFMEQGLLDEAVEEFKIAMKDEVQALDCISLISQCYRKKRNFPEALAWGENALQLATSATSATTGSTDSVPQLALTYDLAQIREDMNEYAAALALYRKVEARLPRYRDTARRIKVLEKISG
jgi:tetratricopeptide (TPR) repeat protein